MAKQSITIGTGKKRLFSMIKVGGL
jgi:hypothetical protein